MVEPKLPEKPSPRKILAQEIEQLRHKEHQEKGVGCGCMAAKLIDAKQEKLLRIESGWVEPEREVLSPLIRQNTEELLLFDAE